MLKQYLDLLKESLENKSQILSEIEKSSEKQSKQIATAPFDMEAFDAIVDEKDVMVSKLNRMDEGFESLYEKISDNLQAEKEQYTEEIRSMQELIRTVTSQSMTIQALEKRNKQGIEAVFARERQKLNVQRSASKAAMHYHDSMNQTHIITPQFLDNKK
ncbi:MAG: hypothetical protein PHY47_14695 [Lachnospiraceae bacterium]|nr:hypothetical protein [Lachnospiraceae bacterium]